RQLYAERAHENPFEFHLPWIDRLYRAALATLGTSGLAAASVLLVPWLKNVSAWQWAKESFRRHRAWILPCAACGLTVAVVVRIPAVLNLHNFARDFVYIAKGRASGDNGMYPACRPAVSYLIGYMPENLGLPLFFAGLI